ncbi:MAG: rod shape-determining protein [Peptococcaceae bacterium]|nr:rod shape-determining protein [Peptococcaceae bacterium]
MQNVGIDLGTVSLLVYIEGRGLVINEPSVIAVDKETGKPVAVGQEAREMIGRTPTHIETVCPMRDGVIADFRNTEILLKYLLKKANVAAKPFAKTRVVVCIPSDVTDIEERAIQKAAFQAGAKKVKVVEEPFAAALGAGLDIMGAEGNLVVDVGGGTTDIAVLSMGGIVCKTSIRVGGNRMDDAIVKYVRRVHNVSIGELTAERIKIEIGCALPEGHHKRSSMEVKGRDLVTGLPKTILITSKEVFRALNDHLHSIVAAVKGVLEQTPPELAGDIEDRGMYLTGGGALLHGFDERLQRETGLKATLTDDPVGCVVWGTGKVLKQWA